MFAKAITRFEPDHRAMLRHSAREWLGRARPLSTLRARAANPDPTALIEIGAMGWLGLLADPDSGLCVEDLVALHRELGRKLLPEPVIASGVLAAMALAWANPADPDLAAICSGESCATLAFAGAPAATSAADVGPQAQRSAAGWQISGTARFVPHAARADLIVLAARSARGVILARLPRDSQGLHRIPGTALDKSDWSDLTFDGLTLPDSALIAGPETGAALLDRLLDLGRLAIAAELTGAAEAVFDLTLSYLRERQQFGRPIGANQALQFTATDLFVQLELANSTLARAARGFDGPDRARLCAASKARCSDAAFETARQAIQLHGAMGYTEACDVSLYVRRIMTYVPWLGHGAALRTRLAAQMAA